MMLDTAPPRDFYESKSEARDEFLNAVQENDVDLVQQHIARGAPVNTIMEDSETTPLHWAIYNCTRCRGPGVLKALLAAPNINVNVQGYFIHGRRQRGTPLHYAVICNKVECVRALLAVPGVDVNAKMDDADLDNEYAGLNWNPLYEAANWGRVDIIHALLSAPNINVNESCGSMKWTALHQAVDSGQLESVKALLSAPNIDVNSRDWQDWTPLHHAVIDWQDWTPLHHAVIDDRGDIIMALLSSPNIDIDSEPPHIRDTLQVTVQSRVPPAIIALLEEASRRN
jgi:ankyrin repeat protein